MSETNTMVRNDTCCRNFVDWE